MLVLKSCPRCNGDLYDNTDIYGNYTACLQCGFYREPEYLRTQREKVQVYRHPWISAGRGRQSEVGQPNTLPAG